MPKLLLFFCISISLFFPKKINATFFPKNKLEKEKSIFDVMYRKGVLEVDFYFNVEEVINNRKDKSEHDAKIVFKDQKGNPLTWATKVNIRGVFRRFQCEEMPPLKLNFKKSDLKKAGLSKFDDYKLVTHCIKDEELAKNLVLKEYLAYKLYNEITEESFRVQLLKINYIDLKTKEVRQHFGFIIEDLALLRDRIGAKKVKSSFVVPIDSFNHFQYQTMAYFQYFIGNLDWGLNPVKNVKIVKRNGKYLAIPYDFDYSSLVNPPYAKLNEEGSINLLKVRIFKGMTHDTVNLKLISFLFSEKKYRLKRVIRKLRKLPWKERRKLQKFIDKFFNEIDTIKILRKSKK